MKKSAADTAGSILVAFLILGTGFATGWIYRDVDAKQEIRIAREDISRKIDHEYIQCVMGLSRDVADSIVVNFNVSYISPVPATPEQIKSNREQLRGITDFYEKIYRNN